MIGFVFEQRLVEEAAVPSSRSNGDVAARRASWEELTDLSNTPKTGAASFPAAAAILWAISCRMKAPATLRGA